MINRDEAKIYKKLNSDCIDKECTCATHAQIKKELNGYETKYIGHSIYYILRDYPVSAIHRWDGTTIKQMDENIFVSACGVYMPLTRYSKPNELELLSIDTVHNPSRCVLDCSVCWNVNGTWV